MTEQNPTYELLKNGQFIIVKSDGQRLKGRFSMYALDRFCEEKKVDNYFSLLQKITIGMKVGDYADLVLIALQDYYRNDPIQLQLNRNEVMDLFDDMGGIPAMLPLFKHAIDRVSNVNDTEKSATETETDKKKLEEALTGMNSGKEVISPE